MIRSSEWTRRTALGACALALSPTLLFAADPVDADAFNKQLEALEKSSGARIGIAAVSTAGGDALFYRESERFLFCSTFKLPLVAAVLARTDRGVESLSRTIRYAKADILAYAPVTALHVGNGMTIAALCEAAITRSDNSAGNILLTSIGGPPAFNAFLASLGDESTHLDRIEPGLNAPEGDKDTTTPAAMLAILKTLLVGTALSAASRQQLLAWLMASVTGAAMLRAGLPKDWSMGYKTGGGAGGVVNEVAIVTPPSSKPFLAAIYTNGGRGSDADRSAVLAAIGQILTNVFRAPLAR